MAPGSPAAVSTCTFVLVKQVNCAPGWLQRPEYARVMRHYLYFCTSKASKLRTRLAAEARVCQRALHAEKSEDGICEFTCFNGTKVQILARSLLALLVSERAFRAEKREEGICEHNVLRQYLYFCISKASKLSTKRALRAEK